MERNDLLERIKYSIKLRQPRHIQECDGLRNIVKGPMSFKLLARTESGKRTEIESTSTYWLIGRYDDIRDFNRAVQDPILEKLAGQAHIRTGHRKIEPINRYNPHIVQLGMPINKQNERNPTDFQKRHADVLDSCHIVDDSLVRGLFAHLGTRPVELEYHNLPCFAGTMHMNRYRDNMAVRKVDRVYFNQVRVNERRTRIIAELESAGADKAKKNAAWQLARRFVSELYMDEACLSEVAHIILDYAAEEAELLR